MSIAPLLNINEYEAAYELYFIKATEQLHQHKRNLMNSFMEFNSRRLNYLHPCYLNNPLISDEDVEERSADFNFLKDRLIIAFNNLVNHCQSWKFILDLDFINPYYKNILKVIIIDYNPIFISLFL